MKVSVNTVAFILGVQRGLCSQSKIHFGGLCAVPVETAKNLSSTVGSLLAVGGWGGLVLGTEQVRSRFPNQF